MQQQWLEILASPCVLFFSFLDTDNDEEDLDDNNNR